MRRITALALTGLLLSGVAAACGDDTSVKDTGATATTVQKPEDHATTTAPATSAEGDTKGDGVITAVDYGYEGVQKNYAPGTVLHMKNASHTEVHEMVVFRVPDNEKRTTTELMALPREQLQAAFAGPPAAVIVAPPTLDGFPVVGDGSVTQPGRYIAFCSIPTGANPSEYMAAAAAAKGGEVHVAGGPPHFVKGMVTEFTVGS